MISGISIKFQHASIIKTTNKQKHPPDLQEGSSTKTPKIKVLQITNDL